MEMLISKAFQFFSIAINFRSSDLRMFSMNIGKVSTCVRILAPIGTDNNPIIGRLTHLPVHNAYQWKVGQY